MRKTIYLSGKITGTDDYMERFAKAERFWLNKIANREIDYTSVMNPAKINANMPYDFTHEDYMFMCFPMIDRCDGIYMLDGWEDSKGSNMELTYAMNRRMEVYYEGTSD